MSKIIHNKAFMCISLFFHSSISTMSWNEAPRDMIDSISYVVIGFKDNRELKDRVHDYKKLSVVNKHWHFYLNCPYLIKKIIALLQNEGLAPDQETAAVKLGTVGAHRFLKNRLKETNEYETYKAMLYILMLARGKNPYTTRFEDIPFPNVTEDSVRGVHMQSGFYLVIRWLLPALCTPWGSCISLTQNVQVRGLADSLRFIQACMRAIDYSFDKIELPFGRYYLLQDETITLVDEQKIASDPAKYVDCLWQYISYIQSKRFHGQQKIIICSDPVQYNIYQVLDIRLPEPIVRPKDKNRSLRDILIILKVLKDMYKEEREYTSSFDAALSRFAHMKLA